MPPGYGHGPPPGYGHGPPAGYGHSYPYGPGYWPPQASHGHDPYGYYAAWTAYYAHAASGAWPAGAPPPVGPTSQQGGDPVEAFIRDNQVDAFAASTLRGLPQPILRDVLAEGSITGTNTSAVLMGRIRTVERKHAAAKSLGGADRSLGGGDCEKAEDVVTQFIADNSIDAGAEEAFRSLDPELQKQVIEEGPLRGTTNPSAVMMSRIRRVRQGGRGPRPPSGGSAGRVVEDDVR